MTDKVQKIREEVERLREKIMGIRTDFADGQKSVLTELLAFIDSLQEEPVSVWHNISEEPNDMSHCLIFYGCKESVGHYLHYEPVLYNKKEKVFVTSSFPHPTGYKVEQKSIDGGCVAEVYKNKRDRISISDITQWCYLKDLHNLSNVERTIKNWKEMPIEEAAVKIAKQITKDTVNETVCNKTVQGILAGANWQKEKDFQYIKKECERVGSCCDEDIAIEAQRRHPYYYTSDIEAYANIGFKEGATWQKAKDQSTIELAEDHAMLAGMNKMEQQIMEKAVDGIVRPDDGEVWCDLKSFNFKDGDKVKVIVIKEN